MHPDTAFHMQCAAGLLLVVLSAMLVALQVDRFDAYKRQIALSSIAVFLAGASAIWYLEEIKAMLWEDPPLAQLARSTAREAADEALTEARNGANGGSGHAQTAAKTSTWPALVRKNRFQDCPSCPEMVFIPAGNDGAPIESFGLGRFELTVQEFHQFTSQTGTVASRQCDGLDHAVLAAQAPAYLQHGLKAAASRPAACLSWGDAAAYLAWLSVKTGQPYRMATAREWAHAARGGRAATAAVGAPSLVQKASLVGATTTASMTIGAAPSNGYGVFDMAGNVAEWVNSCATGSAAIAKGCGQIAMGGSWADGDSLVQSRTASPAAASNVIGLRVARDLPQN